jgi:hypothetical protein
MGSGQDTHTARASLGRIPANEAKATDRRDLIHGKSHQYSAQTGGVSTGRESQLAFYV